MLRRENRDNRTISVCLRGGGSAAGNCSFVTARMLSSTAQRVKTLSAEKPLKGLNVLRRYHLRMFISRANPAKPVEHVCSGHAGAAAKVLHSVAPDFPGHHVPLLDSQPFIGSCDALVQCVLSNARVVIE